ncbi:transposase, MuDR, MULE transposase domain protein [Tanacetum coccineum]|uniref:Transposase, MuDR, MULE transposase domain protein n=1 Tax=Tanacetum coccineum TaxID=301880 RepID=A0ABQ5H4I1_9ASTR
MSQPANDDYSQHLSDDEASYHEDASANEGGNGNSKKRISTGKDGIVRILPPISAAEIHDVEKERKARTILLMAIPKEHLRRFHGMDDAKEIWEAIRTRFGGNANSKKMQKAVLKKQFEASTISSSEGLEKGYDRHRRSKLEYKFQDKEYSEDIFSSGSALEDFICVVFVPDRNIGLGIRKDYRFGTNGIADGGPARLSRITKKYVGSVQFLGDSFSSYGHQQKTEEHCDSTTKDSLYCDKFSVHCSLPNNVQPLPIQAHLTYAPFIREQVEKGVVELYFVTMRTYSPKHYQWSGPWITSDPCIMGFLINFVHNPGWFTRTCKYGDSDGYTFDDPILILEILSMRFLLRGIHLITGSSKDGDGDTSFQWSQFTTQCSHLMFPSGSSSQTREICDVYLTEKELHQLNLDEEALREILEEEARDEKEREDKIRQKQADDEEFFLEFVQHTCSNTPSTQRPVRIIPCPAGIVQLAKLHKQSKIHKGGGDSILSTQEYMKKVVEDVGDDDDFKSGSWVSATDYVNANGGIVSGCLGDIKKFLKKGKLDQVVAIVKSCSPNVIGDLTVTMKDLSCTIPGTIHHKVIGEGGYGNDITVGATLILANVSVFSPKPSMHYRNITKRNVVKVFRKDTVLGSGSGSG